MERKNFNVNGKKYELITDPEEKLVHVLRKQLGLMGTKMACGNGQCGACTVILNGGLKRSCVVKMKNVPDGSVITTVEGIGQPDSLSRLQRAFVKHGCTQCGFCIPGFIVSGTKLLEENESPSREDVRHWFYKNNNLCRCTGYKPMVDAVMDVAKVMRGEEPDSFLDYVEPADGTVWGTRRPRPSAKDKVSGACQYGADIGARLPAGTLQMALVQAQISHGRILNIDTSKAEKMPGVERVITYKDVKGKNRIYGVVVFPWSKTDGFERPILCDEKIFQFGDAIAIVCADTFAHADAAAKFVEVEYEELPAAMNALDAMEEDALEIHPGIPNVYFEQKIIKGQDIDQALEGSEYRARGNFYTQRQPHLVIEPDVGFSYMDGDTLVIQSKSIYIYTHRAMIAAGLGLDPTKIRMVQNVMGGTFGYKLSPTLEALCGVVTLATGRPAYMEYSGYQTITYTGKRAPVFMDMELSADKDCMLTGAKFDFTMDHGPYSEFGDLLTAKILRNVANGYHVPNIYGSGRAVFTNHAFASAMRAYGAPQSQFGSEVLMDVLAEKMGLDPWEIRYRNVFRPGSTSPTGDELDVHPLPGLLELVKPKYERLKAESREFNRKPEGTLRRGVGLGVGVYNVGTDMADSAESRIELNPDNSVTIYNTWEDHGQGGDMGVLQTAHQALRDLGIRPEQIHTKLNDTAFCPDSGPAAASRSQFVVGNAIVNSCEKLMDAMRKDDGSFRTYEEMKAEGLETAYTGSFTTAPFCTMIDPATMQYKPVITYMYAVFLAQVEVDTSNGKTRVVSMTGAVDVGKIGNRLLVEGQIYGGMAQGIGMALSENFEDLKKHTTMRGCGFPTILDVPDDYEVICQETYRPQGPFGSAGCGELPTTAPHPAIINAIYDACGVRITHLPATPDKVLAALERV